MYYFHFIKWDACHVQEVEMRGGEDIDKQWKRQNKTLVYKYNFQDFFVYLFCICIKFHLKWENHWKKCLNLKCQDMGWIEVHTLQFLYLLWHLFNLLFLHSTVSYLFYSYLIYIRHLMSFHCYLQSPSMGECIC